jgi:hypothetical protein
MDVYLLSDIEHGKSLEIIFKLINGKYIPFWFEPVTYLIYFLIFGGIYMPLESQVKLKRMQ